MVSPQILEQAAVTRRAAPWAPLPLPRRPCRAAALCRGPSRNEPSSFPQATVSNDHQVPDVKKKLKPVVEQACQAESG